MCASNNYTVYTLCIGMPVPLQHDEIQELQYFGALGCFRCFIKGAVVTCKLY
jgi:hypothetical protein